MKLAEGLALRSDAQRRLEQILTRAERSAQYQEGDSPAEDVSALLVEARAVITEIEELVRRINRTNATTELEPGLTITDALARRKALFDRRRLVSKVADAAGDSGYGRRLRSELRVITDVSVTDLRREADDLSVDDT